MNSKPSLNDIKKDLLHLQKFEVVLYGSYVCGHFISGRSDIDVAVITRKTSPDENKNAWKDSLKKTNPKYHLNIFELLPLNVKSDIIENHLLVFGDKIELSEYFYHFRKLWKDSSSRYYENQFSSVKEKLEKIRQAQIV